MHQCDLCNSTGGDEIWRNEDLRVVMIDDASFPGFCRVIWNQHAKEMSDLSANQRNDLMHVVFGVEAVMRSVMQPHKINLASLGNVVPHLHWHVIPRFEDDTHFPQPVWGERQRAAVPEQLQQRREQAAALKAALIQHFSS